MGIIQNTLEQGLIYAIMALGVLITYSILDFPDLSVDGTFPLGAAVSALMITRGQSPALALLCAMAAGALAGGLTGLIHVKLKVRDLFSGIIMMTALYAVNMHVAAGSLRMGKANVPFFSTKKVQYATIFENNAEIRRALTQMIDGTLMTENPAALQALYHDMLFDDRYFVLKDFGSYSMAQRRVNDDYQDRDKWLRMAVINTAKSGIFSSDRTIREYNEKIWHLK